MRNRPQDRANSQFYRKLRLNKEFMSAIKHFKKIKKFMLQEKEDRRIENESEKQK